MTRTKVSARDRIVSALETLRPDFDRAGRAVIDAEISAAGAAGDWSSLPPTPVKVRPPAVVVHITDPAAFLDWAEQHGHDGPHPLAGARLDPATARAYADRLPPGCASYVVPACVQVQVPAAQAIANRRTA